MDEAVRFNRQAVEQGVENAAIGLGIALYLNADYKEATQWLRKGVEMGSSMATAMLGECYYQGWGVEKDLEEAKKLFRVAAEAGNVEAEMRLQELEDAEAVPAEAAAPAEEAPAEAAPATEEAPAEEAPAEEAPAVEEAAPAA